MWKYIEPCAKKLSQNVCRMHYVSLLAFNSSPSLHIHATSLLVGTVRRQTVVDVSHIGISPWVARAMHLGGLGLLLVILHAMVPGCLNTELFNDEL